MGQVEGIASFIFEPGCRWLLGFALFGDGVHGGGNGFLVAEVVVFDGFEAGVEFVNEGDTGGDIEAEDFCFGEVVEVFDEGAEGVAVCGDDDALAGGDHGGYVLVPEGEEAGDGVFKALGERELGFGEFGIARVVAGIALVGFFEGWWRDVVAAAPDEDLLVAVFCGGFAFVQALESAVMAFVEAPVFFDGDPDKVEFLEDGPERVEGAFEDGGVGDVEREAFVFEEFTGGFGFGAAFIAEFDVGPAGESVFFIPGAFAVADENEFIHGIIANAAKDVYTNGCPELASRASK